MTSSSRPPKVWGSGRVKKAERLLRPKARLVVRVSRRRWTWTIRKAELRCW